MKVNPAIFSSYAGRLKYFAAYDAILNQWPIPYESIEISTKFGKTHVIASGKKDSPPLILLPGFGANATMWLPNIATLSEHFRAYAFDTIDDLGKSQASVFIKSKEEYVKWITGTLDGLGISKTHVVGFSYGSFLALNLALFAPDRIKRIVALSPAASFVPVKMMFYLRGFLTILHPNRKMFRIFGDWILAKEQRTSELFIEQTYIGFHNSRLRPKIFPSVFNDDELQRIKTPVLILIGDKEVICNPVEAKTRAVKLLSDVRVEIVERAGHTINKDQPETVNRLIIDFLNEV